MRYSWRIITDRCTHCGELMEARDADEKGLEYRHLENESRSCTVTYQAEPYSRWQTAGRFEKAIAIANAKGRE